MCSLPPEEGVVVRVACVFISCHDVRGQVPSQALRDCETIVCERAFRCMRFYRVGTTRVLVAHLFVYASDGGDDRRKDAPQVGVLL